MKVTPKTDEQIDTEGLLPAGTYNFEVREAKDSISKSSGNEMIALVLDVFDDAGDAHTVFDYLLDSFARKIKHAAEVCGLADRYQAGELRAIDFTGRSGRVKIEVKKQVGYADKNNVVDYVVAPDARQATFGTPAPVREKVPAGDLDDEIPF